MPARGKFTRVVVPPHQMTTVAMKKQVAALQAREESPGHIPAHHRIAIVVVGPLLPGEVARRPSLQGPPKDGWAVNKTAHLGWGPDPRTSQVLDDGAE